MQQENGKMAWVPPVREAAGLRAVTGGYLPYRVPHG
jgi:hypothetical protein